MTDFQKKKSYSSQPFCYSCFYTAYGRMVSVGLVVTAYTARIIRVGQFLLCLPGPDRSGGLSIRTAHSKTYPVPHRVPLATLLALVALGRLATMSRPPSVVSSFEF